MLPLPSVEVSGVSCHVQFTWCRRRSKLELYAKSYIHSWLHMTWSKENNGKKERQKGRKRGGEEGGGVKEVKERGRRGKNTIIK